MKIGSYFVGQIFYSFILATLIWFGFMASGSYATGVTSQYLQAAFIFGGGAFYLIINIVYMVKGRRKVQGWGAWIVPISIVITLVMALLGFFGATWLSAFLVQFAGINPLYGFKRPPT